VTLVGRMGLGSLGTICNSERWLCRLEATLVFRTGKRITIGKHDCNETLSPEEKFCSESVSIRNATTNDDIVRHAVPFPMVFLIPKHKEKALNTRKS
jgi:hypothetical protein